MSTLVFHDSPFCQRWHWKNSDGLALYGEQRLKLASIWPGDVICVRLERLDPPLQAAFVHCAIPEQHAALGFMPLRGRKIQAGQKLWAQITKLPRAGKGLALEFIEPARATEKVGARRQPPVAFDIPFEQAQEIQISTHSSRLPSGLKAALCTDSETRTKAAIFHEPQASALFNDGKATLLFEPGSTLTAIDVNGPPTHTTNLLACATIARNIWRQNLYGLIVIDFIKPKSKTERAEITECLKAEYDKISQALPKYSQKPKIEFSPMDHRGLLIVERQKIGVNAWDLQAYDPLLCAATDVLDSAFAVQRPGRDTLLHVSAAVSTWLWATDFRRAQWQPHFSLRPSKTLSDHQWNWTHD